MTSLVVFEDGTCTCSCLEHHASVVVPGHATVDDPRAPTVCEGPKCGHRFTTAAVRVART